MRIYICIKPTNISLGPTDLIWDGEELVMMKTVCELEQTVPLSSMV